MAMANCTKIQADNAPRQEANAVEVAGIIMTAKLATERERLKMRTKPKKTTNAMPTLTQLQTSLKDTPNLSASANDKGELAASLLEFNKGGHIECEKTTLGELARALQVETYWNGRTYSLTIENGAHRVILQTPVISNAK